MEKVKVELTKEDIELFKSFRQYQDDFKVLLVGKIFDFRNGSGTIYRDRNGIIQDIKISQVSYKRKRVIHS